jgi:hypothetical protein
MTVSLSGGRRRAGRTGDRGADAQPAARMVDVPVYAR